MVKTKVVTTKGMVHLDGITSHEIIEMLRLKHYKDVFVSECKNGETWTNRDLLRLDAWVMPKTYSPFTTIGYEVKVDRHDFEQDQKWTGYLGCCHIFFFVCPAGLIRATELPDSVGLIWVSAAGKLHVKRHSARHDPDPEKLRRILVYVLMSRATVDAPTGEGLLSMVDAKRKWIEEAAAKKELAFFVKGHIRDMSTTLSDKENALKRREESVRGFESRLARLGITWDSTKQAWQEDSHVYVEIDRLRQVIDWSTVNQMQYIGQELTKMATEFAELYRSREAKPVKAV